MGNEIGFPNECVNSNRYLLIHISMLVTLERLSQKINGKVNLRTSTTLNGHSYLC